MKVAAILVVLVLIVAALGVSLEGLVGPIAVLCVMLAGLCLILGGRRAARSLMIYGLGFLVLAIFIIPCLHNNTSSLAQASPTSQTGDDLSPLLLGLVIIGMILGLGRLLVFKLNQRLSQGWRDNLMRRSQTLKRRRAVPTLEQRDDDRIDLL